MKIEVAQANTIIQPLRDAGYAVTIFTPEEVGNLPTEGVEEAMIVAGNTYIQIEG